MGRKKSPGLFLRAGIWQVDKYIHRQRICVSTGTASLEEAEHFLARLSEVKRQAEIYGVRPPRTFDQAAERYVDENHHKRSLRSDIGRINNLMPFIGETRLDKIHMGTLLPWLEGRRKDRVAPGTINHGLKVVRRILNLASSEWVDDHGLTWLLMAPKIRLLPDADKRKPYPLTWDEQSKLFQQLPEHLSRMASFAVNTGCRDQEICKLEWKWEVKVPQLDTSVFIIPAKIVKNKEERLVVLNQVALSVIDEQRGRHPTHVFVYEGEPAARGRHQVAPVTRMLNHAWIKARARAGMHQVRVHDLKHTFGRRLRAAGVSFEDRQDLLGHRSGRITTHYSAAELSKLVEAANKVCDGGDGKPELVVLRRLSAS